MQQLTRGKLLHGSTYRIEKVLGQGSFGITYLATHTALDKKVAIKEFFMKELNGRGEDGSITGMSDGSLSMDYARKFQKEALNLSHLEHPNIVRVTDSFADNGTYYYVMDYIEGENLNDYVKTHHVSQQEAVDIIRDVAQALMYMHEEKHMLHLDLKPGNIMRRTSDGHIFLIDFGLSKHYSSDGQPETSTTIGLGTAGYAPIEQANRAKNGEFRPTIDVYALGATFYKLLTRETPPAASELVSDDELLTNNLCEKGVSQQLANIIIQAMLPNVNRRTPSVRAFLSSLPFGGSAVNGSDNHDSYEYVYVSDEEETVVGEQPSSGENVYEYPADNSTSSGNSFIGPMGLGFCAVILILIVFICVRNCKSEHVATNPAASDSVLDSEVADSAVVDYADSVAYDYETVGYEPSDAENGYQELKYSDGSTYKGYMVDGKYEGNGTYTEPNSGFTYEGNWSGGVPSGYGVATWTHVKDDEMCRFEGYFKNGERNGNGTAYYADGTYYNGRWRNGELVSITKSGTWK